MKVRRIHIIIAILICIILYFGFYFFNRFQINNSMNRIYYNDYYNVAHILYDDHPEYFEFVDNKCIMSVEDAFRLNTEFETDLSHDADGNACIGYFIIERYDNGEIEIDTSHICDMIDY